MNKLVLMLAGLLMMGMLSMTGCNTPTQVALGPVQVNEPVYLLGDRGERFALPTKATTAKVLWKWEFARILQTKHLIIELEGHWVRLPVPDRMVLSLTDTFYLPAVQTGQEVDIRIKQTETVVVPEHVEKYTESCQAYDSCFLPDGSYGPSSYCPGVRTKEILQKTSRYTYEIQFFAPGAALDARPKAVIEAQGEDKEITVKVLKTGPCR